MHERKIIIAVSSMEGGGAERVAATLANGWVGQGWSVTLIATFSGRGNCTYPLSPAVRLVYLADLVQKRTFRIASQFDRLFALRRLIESCKPELIISFLPHVNVACVLAAAGTRVPLIVSERTNPALDREATSAQRILRRCLYRFADAVVIQTASVEQAVRDCAPGIGRVAVIPNPVPPSLPVRSAPFHLNGRHRLIACGRLVPEKQFLQLIEIFALLALECSDWDLWIWGEGPQRALLERAVRAHALDDRVFIPGRSDTLWAEMLRSDLFVMTSALEGFPNALLEAMGIGLPAVSFDCEFGPREIMNGGSVGILVTPNDWQELGSSLRLLMSDSTQRADLGSRGSAFVRDHYAMNRVMGLWQNLMDQTMHAENYSR